MATRSLGALTIDLIAKTAGFTEGWNKAEREANRAQQKIAADAKRKAKETEDAWKGAAASVGNLIGGALAGLSIGAGFQKFITETVQAQKEQAGLAAALKTTGNAAGFSLERLNEMAGQMEATTGIAAGELNQAQKVLTGFTNIVGENYAKALKSAADYSAYTGQSMVASAELMGRALNIPSVGMAALAKQGFKFTEEQIKLVKSLEETGRVAEAQKIVFDALEETYGGAAEAARDTLGGAMSALKNTINSLMTGEGGSVDGLTKSINGMVDVMANEQTRSAFQTLLTWMAELATMTIKLTANMIAFIQTKDKIGALTGTDEFGKMTSGAKDAQKEVERLTGELTRMIEVQRERPGDDKLAKRIDAWRAKLLDAQTRAQGVTDVLKNAGSALKEGIGNPSGVNPMLPDLSPRKPGAIKLKDDKPAGGKSQTQKDFEAAEKYILALRETADARNNLNNYEKLALDLENGKVVLTDKQLEQAKDLALQADERVYREKQLNEELAYRTSLYDEARSLTEAVLTPTEKWVKQVERLNELSAAGVLDQETYARTVKKYYKDLTDETDSFALNFQKNVQDTIGNTLVQGLSGSFKDIAASFLKMLLQMEAQAAAANFMRLLTGEGEVKSSFLGGLVSKAGGWISSLISGGRVSGGPVASGSLYRVNELGPELLSYGGSDYLMMGGSGGYVKPLGAATTEQRSGSGNVTIVNQTTGRIDKVEQRQLTREEVVLIIQEQTPGIMVSQTQNASSPFSRTMQSSFNTSRRR